MSQHKFDPQVIVQERALLRQKLGGRYRYVDTELLEEAIDDALIHYHAHPETFDSSRAASLLSYLVLRVRHYLDKKLQKERRHQQHEKAAGVSDKNFEKIMSEVRVGRGIYVGRDKNDRDAAERQESLERQRAILNAIMADLDTCDLDGVRLLLAGASTDEWVKHLGIEHLPHEEQHAQVKREKDRLIKKLQRRAQKVQGKGSSSDRSAH